jgi:hypothetical protein
LLVELLRDRNLTVKNAKDSQREAKELQVVDDPPDPIFQM